MASSMAAETACDEKNRLLRAYSFATSDFIRAVTVLHQRSGVMSKEDYEGIRRYADKTRELTEEARIALERHTAEHGC
jgi:hypothetical protein